MSFIHQALKEWQQERKKPPHSPASVEQEQRDRNELRAKQTICKYRERYKELKREYGIKEKLDIELAVDEDDPKTWKQAIASPNKSLWLQAALDKMIAITYMATFDFVTTISQSRRALPSK